MVKIKKGDEKTWSERPRSYLYALIKEKEEDIKRLKFENGILQSERDELRDLLGYTKTNSKEKVSVPKDLMFKYREQLRFTSLKITKLKAEIQDYKNLDNGRQVEKIRLREQLIMLIRFNKALTGTEPIDIDNEIKIVSEKLEKYG